MSACPSCERGVALLCERRACGLPVPVRKILLASLQAVAAVAAAKSPVAMGAFLLYHINLMRIDQSLFGFWSEHLIETPSAPDQYIGDNSSNTKNPFGKTPVKKDIKRALKKKHCRR